MYHGLKGSKVEVDVIIRDGEVVAIEAESYAEEEDVDALALKTRYLERILGKRVAKAYIVAVNISKEALKRAKELRY
ncbi:MAG: hypothetical protein DRJ67_03335 [Thermoprotei archaeon]|nr:MAG: hypothetical protein DRJ67_03335 [Thermoprotei archaeon]